MVEGFPDIFLLNEKSFQDERGSFLKLFDTEVIRNHPFIMKQQNFVTTKKKGIFRGLHYQTGKHAEAKIFRVLSGSIQLLFFDTRQESSTFEKSGSIVLDNVTKAVFLPKGFATGYLTLQNETQVLYLSDEDYTPESEAGISALDPVLNVELMINSPELSEKDRNWPKWDD